MAPEITNQLVQVINTKNIHFLLSHRLKYTGFLYNQQWQREVQFSILYTPKAQIYVHLT